MSWLTPKKVREIWVIGDKRSASLDHINQSLDIYNKGVYPDYDSYGEFTLMAKQDGDDTRRYIPPKEPLKEEVEHFLACIREKKKPVVDGVIANNVVKIIEFAYQSMEEKRAVEIRV